jgi:hypothetical protein
VKSISYNFALVAERTMADQTTHYGPEILILFRKKATSLKVRKSLKKSMMSLIPQKKRTKKSLS